VRPGEEHGIAAERQNGECAAMMTAVGCLLHVPDDRSDLLLFEAEHGRSFYWTRPYVSELVPGRDHNDNRGAPPP